MTIDFKMDEKYPITPNIYLKGEPILHNRIDSLVSSGWEIIEIRGNVIIDFDTMTSEILRAIKCPWNIPDYGSQWTLDYIEDIDQWLDISHGFLCIYLILMILFSRFSNSKLSLPASPPVANQVPLGAFGRRRSEP